LTPCFAHSGEILFFAPPKKSIQKKGDPGGLPAARVSCASRKARRSRNSLRSNRRERHPAFTAMLGCARGVGEFKTNTRKPFALTEYRSHSGNQARTLSERIERSEIASCARPRRGEERKESAQPMSAPGCPSLWVLSLGHSRESTSPKWAKHKCKKSLQNGHRMTCSTKLYA
jgi:hypothetical protein